VGGPDLRCVTADRQLVLTSPLLVGGGGGRSFNRARDGDMRVVARVRRG